MLNALLLSLLLAQAATPPKPAPKPQPTTPPKAAPAQPRTTPRQAANTVAGMAITVTDGKGTPFPDVAVEMTGAAAREGKTDAAGQLSFPGLRAGTYRLRFSGESVTAFEREVTLKAGEIAKLPITLTPAAPVKVAPAPPPAAPAPPPAPAAGPVGQPQLGSLAKLADQHRNTKERREVMLSCSGNTRNMLLALTDEQPQRIYDTAEATFYVLSGQGAAIVGKLQSLITTGSFIAVPRGTPFVLARQGNRPLIMLWTLSGEPCEAAK
jgi:mannose-6-phosphate isomerase-like protein (cupin superfamily)